MNPSVVLVDKPAGPTSFGCVAKVRGALGGRKVKVGHAGTLDPFATGLLALLVGRATRLAPYLVGLDKRYRVTAQLGVRSDTGDPEGTLDDTASGAEAWTRFQETRPDVVLLDLVLGDADGLDVLRKMKQEAPDTKVILISAHGSIESAVTARKPASAANHR